MKLEIKILTLCMILLFNQPSVLAQENEYLIEQYNVNASNIEPASTDPNNPSWQSFNSGQFMSNISRIIMNIQANFEDIVNFYLNNNSDLMNPMYSIKSLVQDVQLWGNLLEFTFDPIQLKFDTNYYILFYIEQASAGNAVDVRLNYGNPYPNGESSTNPTYDFYFITYSRLTLQTTQETKTVIQQQNFTQTIHKTIERTNNITITANQTLQTPSNQTTPTNLNYPLIGLSIVLILPIIIRRSRKR